MEQNICHFIPFHKDALSVHTINFVYETSPQIYERLKSESVYKLYYVCEGQGCIHTPGKITPLSAGDVFFTFPAALFAIESTADFAYMYISFVGLRGNKVMESLHIGNNNFVFHHMEGVGDFWREGLTLHTPMMDLISESVLLYTFAMLGERLLPKTTKSEQSHSVDLIKKYLDDHFTDHDLSLERVSRDLSYNKKYASHVFKKHFGVGIVEYVNTVRIQNACTMIEQGFTGVSDIAERCGYADAQYFSKIFKARMSLSPTQYIRTVQEDKE